MVDGVWYPFVRVPLGRSVTAVVGANESGKTHLIDAIDRALTGEGIDRGDFCRYSDLYEVERGTRRNPDFGVSLRLESDEDRKALPKMTPVLELGDEVTLLRLGDERNLLIAGDGAEKKLSETALAKLESRLPKPLRLKTNIPLPDGISLSSLLGRDLAPFDNRKRRFRVLDSLRGLSGADEGIVSTISDELANLLKASDPEDSEAVRRREESAELAKSLLLEVANIEPSAFKDLEHELREGSEGKVGGLVARMNGALARHLNISRWWTQDSEFRLELEARERDLAFIIRDRTGTKYSFAERSRGLTYFLSYFVQLKLHRLRNGSEQADGIPEVLLMDEPDAYLSSLGQQDLLRALEDFALPAAGERRDQVVYVTHSPFLINRNAAHRIRVLDKGTDQEGTRVVKDVSQNHYEPLRTSIGVSVAETAFIGGSNLLVEGAADQVLLSSLTSQLEHRGIGKSQLIDLNETTIIPAGGAEHVPYMAFLARGRDAVKPACVALLDGDEPGLRAAARILDADGLRRKAIIKKDFVLDFASWAQGADGLELPTGLSVREIEDLIPPGVALAAARSYAIAMLRPQEENEVDAFAEDSLRARLGEEVGLWDAVKAEFAAAFDGAEISKVGFAKEVAAYLDAHRDSDPMPSGLATLEANFGALIATLSEKLQSAESEEISRRTNRRSDLLVKAFLDDYPDPPLRDRALKFLRDLEASLENISGDDRVRSAIGEMRRRFDLGRDPLEPVPEYEVFRQKLRDLQAIRRNSYGTDPDASPAERAAASD
jgi:energy-coupling factor transporter ATP-binding protein EcfA2